MVVDIPADDQLILNWQSINKPSIAYRAYDLLCVMIQSYDVSARFCICFYFRPDNNPVIAYDIDVGQSKYAVGYIAVKHVFAL